MLVLDLDLDFFVSPVLTSQTPGQRPADSECSTWTEKMIRTFLEDRCDLDSDAKTLGAIVETHDQVLQVWETLVADRVMPAPFDVWHIDAHHDLGGTLGDSEGTLEVCNELILLPVDERIAQPREHCGPGNYLPYAVAYGWIRSLSFVVHPEADFDPPWPLFTDKRDGLCLSPMDGPRELGLTRWVVLNPQDYVEPVVPVAFVELDDFGDPGTFDFVFASKSPGFVPTKGDWMAGVVGEYISSLPSN